jgi:predicted nucleic acid-binding protein
VRIIDLVYSGRFHCVHDDRILMEYREVLSRPKFASAISEHQRDDLIDYPERRGPACPARPDWPACGHRA